jgi:dihydroorotase
MVVRRVFVEPAVTMTRVESLQILTPDDWHLHLRDGSMLELTVPHAAVQFGRAIVMPNLKPPVTTVEQAAAYRERILEAVPQGHTFVPLMTLYLTDNTTPDEIHKAKASGIVHAVKLYPAGATTNSSFGVTNLDLLHDTLSAMTDVGMPLCVHGEVTDPHIDIFDREAEFIERVLRPLIKRHPLLRVIMEHITTEQAVRFVESASPNVGATITAHHLLYNRSALFQGGLRPHLYCLPVLKAESHRQALLVAATSGNPKFFLGSDSAPHLRSAKESCCGCAGIYTGATTLALYAEAFESVNALSKLEGFASRHGALFYGMPIHNTTKTLKSGIICVPTEWKVAENEVVPLRAGETVKWEITNT